MAAGWRRAVAGRAVTGGPRGRLTPSASVCLPLLALRSAQARRIVASPGTFQRFQAHLLPPPPYTASLSSAALRRPPQHHPATMQAALSSKAVIARRPTAVAPRQVRLGPCRAHCPPSGPMSAGTWPASAGRQRSWRGMGEVLVHNPIMPGAARWGGPESCHHPHCALPCP